MPPTPLALFEAGAGAGMKISGAYAITGARRDDGRRQLAANDRHPRRVAGGRSDRGRGLHVVAAVTGDGSRDRAAEQVRNADVETVADHELVTALPCGIRAHRPGVVHRIEELKHAILAEIYEPVAGRERQRVAGGEGDAIGRLIRRRIVELRRIERLRVGKAKAGACNALSHVVLTLEGRPADVVEPCSRHRLG